MSTNIGSEQTTPASMDLDPPSGGKEVGSTQEQKPSAATEDPRNEPVNTSDALSDPDPLADSSSDSDAEKSGGEGTASRGISAEDKLVRAVSYKDRGNERIATGDSAGALKHYERGIKIASRLPSSDAQTKALLVSLRLNLALACTKEGRYSQAASLASEVLEVDRTNVKALFRRGVARARLGSLEDAKADLMAVVKADPRNGGAKKELKSVRDRLLEHRQREKASYGGLFDKGPMYNDKEVERQKREAEAAKRRKEEEEAWAKSNEERKAQGKAEQTLEDWKKAKKEEEEKVKKENEEQERKSKPRPPPPSKPAAPPKKASSKDGKGNSGASNGDEMELDEEDLKIIQDTKKQGYCYFKRTLSEKDQSLLDAEQLKLRARVSPPPAVPEKGEEQVVGNPEGNARSAWNEAGTWEEVDKTEWCKGKLTEALSKVSVTVGNDAANDPEYLLEKLGGFDFGAIGGDEAGSKKSLDALSELKRALTKFTVSVTNVEILGGDANVICVSKKIKHIFDFNVKIKFSLSIDESMRLPPAAEEEKKAGKSSSVKTHKGKLVFPDMTNNDVDNGRFDSEPELTWDKGARWDATYKRDVDSCMRDFKADILSALESFFVEYKSS